MSESQLRPFYMACRDPSGEMLAACPFFYNRRKYFLYLESLPSSLIGGPVVSESEIARNQIMDSLLKSVKFSPLNPVTAMSIRVHQKAIINSMAALGLKSPATHCLLVLDLQEKTPESIWNNGFQKHDRRAIKFFEKKGTEFRFAREEKDYLDFLSLPNPNYKFYRDRLGRADVFSKMRLNLGDRLAVAIAFYEDKMIAGIPLLLDPSISMVHTIRGLRYSSLNIHEPMANVTYCNWKVVNWAHEHGYRYVDFGSYPISGVLSPHNPFSKFRERFQLEVVPWHRFTVPTSKFAYALARRIIPSRDSSRGALVDLQQR